MSINYRPLWKLLIDHNMKKTDLIVKIGISQSTLAKMGKNEYVSLEVLDRICNYFSCQISDILEHIAEKSQSKQ